MRRKLLDVASRLGSAVDEAILRSISSTFAHKWPPREAQRAPEGPAPNDRHALLAQAIAFYQRPEILSGERFFQPPPPLPRVHEEKRGPLPDGEIVDVKWESGFVPHWELVREDYLRHQPNRYAFARILRHDEPPRAQVVCIHGYRGGAFLFEERAFPTRWLYKLGLDVILVQLPFHALRGGADAPVWPSVNVGRTNEGFAQAIWDLRALRDFIARTRGPRPTVVTGMSLGGYTTALWATLEPLALAVPMIPVASFPDLLWAHGEGSAERARAEREGITVEMLRQAMACHTPLQRRPANVRERVLVLSAAGDRIAPPEHAEKLARHFDAEALSFVGGHVLQVGRGLAFRALARRMARLDLLPPR